MKKHANHGDVEILLVASSFGKTGIRSGLIGHLARMQTF